MRTKTIVKILVSLVFVIVLAIKIDFKLLVNSLSSMKFGYYVISLLFLMLNTVILAAKYKIVMAPTGIRQSLGQLIKINFMCRYYSMFLSSAVGQSVIRWYYTTKNSENRWRFVSTILFERASFAFALITFLLISGLLLTSHNLNALANQILYFLIILLAILIFYYTYLLQPVINVFINKRVMSLANHFRETVANRLNYFIESLVIYCNNTNTLIYSLALAFLWQSVFLIRVYFLTVSIDVPLSWVQLIWMASLVLFLQSIPLSLNGIGLREGAYAYLFSFEGLPVESGVSLGILLFSQVFIIAIIGGVMTTFQKN
jgi:hypothetical protein